MPLSLFQTIFSISLMIKKKPSNDFTTAPAARTGLSRGMVRVSVVCRIMMRSLSIVHSFWRSKDYLTTEQIVEYERNIVQFAKSWHAFQWKPSVWVHWMVAHSTYYICYHKTIYLFSSVPSEHRHQTFKLDLRHSFQGWKLINPRCYERGLRHVVELDALVQGLRLLTNVRNKRKRLQ